MYQKLNDLQFVIGLFFSIIALILLLNVLLASNIVVGLNTLTGVSFLVFGLGMMFVRGKTSGK